MYGPAFRSRTVCILLVALLIAAPPVVAGKRGRGKYNGVVFYDRWDNCYLFSGVYLMYISNSVKEVLRPYRGRSIEINATEVHQPMNPGDGLITRLNVVGESTKDLRPINPTPDIRGLELKATVSKISDRVRVVTEIRNNGASEIPVESDAVGFAVIAHDKPIFMCPSDGTSCAVITRTSATSPDGQIAEGPQTWTWAFDASDRLPNRFTLRPGEVRTTTMFLNLQPGEYQFIAGYGGGVHAGPCAASNAVWFAVSSR